jgi:N6-L-threonylcarbamoyladenine synthase
MRILAIETSCDETAAAVVEDGTRILSSIVSSQAAIHGPFGGVVPELASRHHLENICPVIAGAMEGAGIGFADLDAVAVTQGPGLVGALLVGVATAKGLAAGRGLPLAPVDHLQGHVAANFLEPDPIEPPFVCLIASGGHTLLARVTGHSGFVMIVLTIDDD